MTLEVNNISKVYPNGAGVHNISFKIDKCGVYGLLGKNGAGKSTLMNVITGYIAPTSSCGTKPIAPNGTVSLVLQQPKKI